MFKKYKKQRKQQQTQKGTHDMLIKVFTEKLKDISLKKDEGSGNEQKYT